MSTTIFFSLEHQDDKGAALLDSVALLGRGIATNGVYECNSEVFDNIPNSPLCYWLPSSLLTSFRRFPLVKEQFAVRSGSVTFDDFRFLRLSWEIPPGLQRTGDRFFWHPISKGGEYSQFVADVHLLVDWKDSGNYVGESVYMYRPREGYGWGKRGRNTNYFGKPSVTWSRRSQKGFSARVLPAGNVFSDKSPVVQHGETSMLWYFVGIANTAVFRSLLKAQIAFGSYEVGAVERSPLPVKETELVVSLAKRLHALKQAMLAQSDRNRLFCPPRLSMSSAGLRTSFEEANQHCQQLEREAEGVVAELESAATRAYELAEPVLDNKPTSHTEEADSNVSVDESAVAEFEAKDASLPGQAADLISHLLGCAFGRWDIRFSTGEKPKPVLPDPFAALPVCPPAMLQNEQGLPLTEADLPPFQAVDKWHYPLDIPWDGILVDDPGHPMDIEARTRQILEIIWKDRAEKIEREACEILTVATLRDYFRKPASFFAEHLKRYSKSRRKAPIYWCMATTSSSYSIWLYYHRYSKDTFFKVLNDHVKPKLEHEERRLESLRAQVRGESTRSQREEIDGQETLVAELKNFREEVERIAPLWNPNLNDGVTINFAPLWRLVPQHKAWQNECKECWETLVRGDYDWAFLAMHLWPERVVLKCRDDASLAIAHGLEDVFWEQNSKGKWKKKPISVSHIEELIRERSKPAVKAALEGLLSAPAPGGGLKSRKARQR